MEDIGKTFTIQWVGPFASFEAMNTYLSDEKRCDAELFTFYYCSGSKVGRGHPYSKKDYRYLGIHKSGDSIAKRVNSSHEHLRDFRDGDLSLWIGAFGNQEDITDENIEFVETVFISTYKDLLSENDKKKKSILKKSVCIVNLWYKENEQRWIIKKPEVKLLDDILLFEEDTNQFSVGNLSVLR